MKYQDLILRSLVTSSVLFLCPVASPGWGTPVEEATPIARSEAIPIDQIGAVAGKQYSGDGLTVTAMPGGARLHCTFQRLDGQGTREGLWLTSTVSDTMADRFQVKATAMGRKAANKSFNDLPPNSFIQLPASGSITIDGQKIRFTRPGLVEEYTVSVDGVRQDFVVTQPPTGTGELHVRLQVSGAQVKPTAFGVQLVLEKSGRKIAYSQLRATDAKGRELHASIVIDSVEAKPADSKLDTLRGNRLTETASHLYELEPADATLAVVVDDAGAVYPVRIDPTFSDANWVSFGGIQGVNGPYYNVDAIATDGSGNVYVGGDFTVAGSTIANRIAKWDGNNWSALGSGMNDIVGAIAVSGSNVFAGGSFTNAGGVAANYIAQWDGSSWSAMGTGMNAAVQALAVSGNNVYAGGTFTNAGGVSANGIAMWDGSHWSPLGSGLAIGGLNHPIVRALAVWGSDLYVAGDFWTAGGNTAYGIAKWDGSSWSSLGSGLSIYGVYELAVSSSYVYAECYTYGSQEIDVWDGYNWTTLSYGQAAALAASGGNLFVAGGTSDNQILKWDGSSWSELGSSDSPVQALAASGSDLYVGGRFHEVGANGIAKWNGSSWSALGSGMSGPVNATAISGNDLYVGGTFKTFGGITANNIAKWNGSAWSALGLGITDPSAYPYSDGSVKALAASGSNVYVGGRFTLAGGITASNIAKWDGTGWVALGSGTGGTVDYNRGSTVDALAVSGGNVYAGGWFTSAGGNTAKCIAKWDGSTWSALGSGMNDVVYALAVSGSNVFAGGAFNTAGDSPATNIARWNGNAWSTLGAGIGNYGFVYALATAGSNLYVGGWFTLVGGVVASNIARWDGSSWSPLGSGLNYTVFALAAAGSNVFAGGAFTNASGVSANYIAKWDGSAWSALGSGMDNTVYTLALSGNDLFAGGYFMMAGGKVSAYVAEAMSANSVPLVIVTRDSLFGFTNRQFRFGLTGPAGSNAVIQASTNLQTWIPLQTNSLPGGTFIFTDTQASNYFRRFYRAMLLP